MNRGALWMALVVIGALFNVGCGCGSSTKVTITHAPTTVVVNTTSSVTATVSHDSAAGGVNWNCTPVGTCGSFNPAQTASGVSSVYTAPPTTGTVTIIATSVDKPSRSASVSVTIAASTVVTSNFTFYVIGENHNARIYCIAGVVAIAQTASGDGSFAVVSGEQDYNDGNGDTATDDALTGGRLALAGDGSGFGTLTLVTASGLPGIDGTETFTVNFPNANHALITEFDASATSSGSLDLQTSTAVPVGSFAFTLTGAADLGDGFFPTAFGGVFGVDDSGNVRGIFDTNLGGSVTPGTDFPDGIGLGATDNFGRGLITGNTSGISTSLVYYVVGPEVVRIIDIDSATPDTAVGSAYGQGDSAGGFSNESIGPSVFSMSQAFTGYAAVGEFFTFAEPAATPRTGANPKAVREGTTACSGESSSCAYSGVGDLNELFEATPIQLAAAPISGTYAIGTNGYGSLTVDEGFGDLVTFGVYAVDPSLNILDPNDTTDTTGGALIAEMDSNLIGVGSIVPQSDIAVADFNGTYSFGGQGNTDEGDEFDLVGEATAASDGTVDFNGIGLIADPFGAVNEGFPGDYFEVAFTGSAVPDDTTPAPGRYTISPLTVNFGSGNTIELTVGVYQASASQLFWVETDDSSYFVGPLELFPGTGGTDAKKRAKNKKH